MQFCLLCHRPCAMFIALVFLPLLARASNEFGTKFLEKNKVKDGVITLPSGLQYKVLRSGTGSDHPTEDSPCSCHYEGRTAENYPSGQKFDSSYDRGQPTTFAPNQVISGWTTAMQRMVEGDKWEMYIPSDLAYGEGGRPPKIPKGAVLVFTMEIIKIQGGRIPAKKDDAIARQDGIPANGASSSFRAVFDVANLVGTPSNASFTVEVHPEWAPRGAKRLQELVQAKFFDGVRFFRVIDGFMAQFGIHGDPSVMRQWGDKKIKDDEKVPGVGNKRGRMSFAMAGPSTRSTQFFINFHDNNALDDMGFPPVAEVVDGMDVVDRIFKIGEGAPRGPGPGQGDIQAQGNAYLNKRFPQLSYIKSCSLATNSVSEESSKVQTGRSKGTEEVSKPMEQDESMVQDLGDGLKLLVTQTGDGKTFPDAGDMLTMHYTLTLASDSSGAVIDSSRSRNQPFTFAIGQGEVIKGWDQGVMKMSLGQRGVLTVPSALGYGVRGAGGAIPPNADLKFDVEVLGIGYQRSASASLELSNDSHGMVPLTIVAMIVVSFSVLICIFKHARKFNGGKLSKPDAESKHIV